MEARGPVETPVAGVVPQWPKQYGREEPSLERRERKDLEMSGPRTGRGVERTS